MKQFNTGRNFRFILRFAPLLVLQTSSSAFQPIHTSHKLQVNLGIDSVRHGQASYAPSMAAFGGSERSADASTCPEHPTSLSYLVCPETLPPRTRDLLTQLSENYIYSTRRKPVTLDQVLQVIEAEHTPLDVPIVLDNLMIDVKETGDEIDESVAEIFSLAAMYGLPKEITMSLLDSCILGAEQGSVKSELQICRDIFAAKGWHAVLFPKGLALQLMKRYQPRSSASNITPFFLLRRQSRRVKEAKQAVIRAAEAEAPKQQYASRQDLLRTMEEELFNNDSSLQPSATIGNSRKLFFPSEVTGSTLRRGFRRMYRVVDKQFARLKHSGRAGIVSYCFMNLLFYTVGVVWQWQRVSAPMNPLQASSVTTILLKKFVRVFSSLYFASQITKVPKVVVAVALTPVAQRIMNATKRNLRVSENVATILLVGLQYVLWLGVVMVPILSEYARLSRMIDLERLVDIKQVVPAFHTVTMGVLHEC